MLYNRLPDQVNAGNAKGFYDLLTLAVFPDSPRQVFFASKIKAQNQGVRLVDTSINDFKPQLLKINESDPLIFVNADAIQQIARSG